MPMIDVYATAGTFGDPRALARKLASEVMAIEQVPDIPMFRQNTAAFIHDLPTGNLSNVDGDSNYVRIQVLTNAGALDRGKQLAVVEQLTRIAADAAGDPTLASRTWVLLTEAPDGGWGLDGHANTNEELVAAARVQIASHSDGRPELIAPDTSGAFLARLIEQGGLGAPHVVGPDVGTAAALFLAARAPERVTSLTVGGGAVRFPIEAGGAPKDIIEAPSLDLVRGLDARTNIGSAVESAAASDREPDVHEDYVSAYDLGRFAESARFVRQYPGQNPVLGELLATITTPTQSVAGRDDDLVPWSNNQYLDDLLPNSELHPLDAGHFAWEQAAEDYGRLVVDWVSGGYRRVGGGP
jgi:pimeloyl-ACP methyl ester carboxylesterase